MGMSTETAKSSTPSPLTAPIRQHPVAWFYILAYVLGWLAVLPLILARAGGNTNAWPTEPFLIAGALAGPTLAGLIVTAATTGAAGVGRWLSGLVRWRVGVGWYALALFGPLATLTLTAGVLLGAPFLNAMRQGWPLLLTLYLPALIVGALLGPLWEEPGWRGVALPRLQPARGPLGATLIVALLWAAWHLPGYLGGWLGPLTISSFLALLVGSIGFSLVLTWAYNGTRGSLLLIVLLHSASNAAISFGGRFLPTGMSPGIAAIVGNGWIPAITYLLWGLIVLLLTRGRLGYEPGA